MFYFLFVVHIPSIEGGISVAGDASSDAHVMKREHGRAVGCIDLAWPSLNEMVGVEFSTLTPIS